MKPLSRLTPHSHLSHNPLFALEARHTRWGESGVTLARRSGIWIGVGALVVVMPFVIWMALELPRTGTLSLIYQSGTDYVAWALAIGLLLGLLVDCGSIAVSIGSINGEMLTGRWDLLRLTLLRIERLIAAKHGTAQLRAWRLMALVVGVRVGAVALLIFLYSSPVFLAAPIFIDPLEVTFGYVLIIALSLIFIAEPLWRMRALTAVGLVISSRMHSSITTILMAASYVFALWIVEGFVFSVVGVAMSWLFGFGALVTADVLWFLCFGPFFVGIISVAIWGYYHIVETWALRRAALTLAHFN